MTTIHNPIDHNQNQTSELPTFVLHYEIRACLDANPLAPVFEAWDTKLHRLVVIKQLHHLGGDFELVLARARKVAALSHSAFAKIHALEEVDSSIYIVMEAVQGKCFADWIKDHQGQENLALVHVKQIAAALHEAHQSGLIHGDLKPANLMVDVAGRARILNLGFAAYFDPHAVKNVAEIDPCGSIAYLAPERFVDLAPTSASDVFALGTILYQSLIGHAPFSHLSGLSLVAAQAQSVSGQWDWPDKISEDLRNLILGMTTRDSTQRLRCDQIQEACKKLTTSEGQSHSQSYAGLAALPIQLEQLKRRRRQKYAGLLLVVLCLFAVAIWNAQPNWGRIAKVFKPYAESRELEQGMQALAMYDKPGMLDKATTHFNTVLEHDSNNARAVAGLSIVYNYRFRGNSRDEVWREKALASSQRALQLNADLALTQVAYALSLDPHQQFDLAMAAVARAKKMEPQNLMAWQTEMRILLLARRYGDAITCADNALQLFPSDWLILILKGLVYFNQAKYDIAEPIFRMSIQHNPDSILSYNFLAKTLDAMGRRDESLQVLQQGLQVRSDAHLYLTLGQTKFSQGDFAAAAAALEKAVTINPQDYEIWSFLADALIEVPGKQKEAIVAYTRARELLAIRMTRRPNDGWIISVMAVLEVRLGEFERAKKLVISALELAPTNPVAHFQVAKVYEIVGQRKNALNTLEKAKKLGLGNAQIEAEPTFKELRKDIHYLK